ncbi:NADH-ubiquinone oxidoreductase, subunit 4L [Methylophaga lonarensis MPL]|uniref:NADH-ubiquinone oxidoreductase, subunit 4L n=1 Tax=Methylophaga lonarensis MPL TaxID=1286106 RepID=M7P2U8_9GAMM|nr:NADH-quinone oxidoreductase subunit K [Methylophaga lonarensis]EMR13826.1 NADH-ubiquinone oxidoreductase, subunit 4L [Methylophaga lonarensis MPL]
MTLSLQLFLATGGILWLTGLYGLWRNSDPIRRIISLNIMGSGVFLVMVTLARRETSTDPVLHALVVTGLVVAVSATAFALRLAVASQQEKR